MTDRGSGIDTGASAGEEGEPALVAAGATAATYEQAYEQATRELLLAVCGDEAWARALDLPVHDPERDLLDREDGRGQVTVTLGLERARVIEFLDQLAGHSWQTPAPPPLAGVIGSAYERARDALVCRQRQALLGEPCAAAEADMRELEAFARQVELRLVYAGGVPVDDGDQPLRPVKLAVERVAPGGARRPLAGVPVVVWEPPGVQLLGEVEGVTDAAGMVELAFRPGVQLSGPLRGAVDLDRLLGPLSGLWPPLEVEIVGRRVSGKHWTVVSVERVRGQVVADGLFAKRLDEDMRQRGAEPVMALAHDTIRAIQTAQPQALGGLLGDLADTWQGRVDRVLVVEVDSEYASRMGSHRVWYEARARGRIYDAWTGRQVAVVDETVTESGIGDDRADRAARARLAAKVAELLQSGQ